MKDIARLLCTVAVFCVACEASQPGDAENGETVSGADGGDDGGSASVGGDADAQGRAGSGSAGAGSGAPSPAVDAGGDSAAGTAAMPMTQNAVAVPGNACATEGERACVEHDDRRTLTCNGGAWEDSTDCDATSRCDTTLGATQGTCQAIASLCQDQQPGDAICDGLTRKRCDADRLGYALDNCPLHAHCDASAEVTCVCNDGFAETGAAPGLCEDIDECATDNGGCDPLVTCTDGFGTRGCGTCPARYRGDGQTGCIPYWTQQLGTTAGDVAAGVATDASGNLYVTGYSEGGLDGNTNAGASDAVLIKYDAAGTRIWTRQFGTDQPDEARAVATDAAGNVYVTGWTEGSLDGVAPGGTESMFFVKYDSAGARQWMRQLGNGVELGGYAIAIDADGNAYISCSLSGTIDGHSSAGYRDGLIVKYDSAGARVWSRQFGTLGFDFAGDIETGQDGSVHVSWTAMGTDPGTGDSFELAYVTKYSGAGDELWTRTVGGAGQNLANGVAIDGSGNVYSTGRLQVLPSEFDHDVFVAKHDGAGNLQWQTQFGAPGVTDGGSRIATDANGSVYVLGGASGRFPDAVSSGYDDLFVAKLDQDGHVLWIHQFGANGYTEGNGLAIDPSGYVYVAGDTSGELDGSPNAGGYDLYVCKYDANGTHL